MPAKKNPHKPVPEAALEPEEPTPAQRRRPWYIALLIVGLVLLGASTALAMTGGLDELEREAFNVVNHASLPGWLSAQLAKPLSNAVWGMVGLVVVFLAIPKLRLRAWQYVVAGGSAYALVSVIEHLVDRARPAGLAGYDALLRASQGGAGFPSGHVAVLTALGLTAWPYVNWAWRALIILLVVAEGWSRVYLGVHAPLDIVGGLAAGMVVVATIHLLPSKIGKFFRLSR